MTTPLVGWSCNRRSQVCGARVDERVGLYIRRAFLSEPMVAYARFPGTKEEAFDFATKGSRGNKVHSPSRLRRRRRSRWGSRCRFAPREAKKGFCSNTSCANLTVIIETRKRIALTLGRVLAQLVLHRAHVRIFGEGERGWGILVGTIVGVR